MDARRSRAVERVLVIPFADGIGDFVLMLPLLAAIRRRYPNAALTVAASSRSALLLNREVQPRIEVRSPSWLDGAPPQTRTGTVGRLWPQSSLAWLEGVRLRWEFGRFDRVLNLHYWWERGYDFDRHWTPQVPPRAGVPHTLDFLADRLGRELGESVPTAARRPRAHVRAAAGAWADAWWQANGLAGWPVVALIPASNMRIKRWPIPSWVRVCDALVAQGTVPLLLLPPGADPAERVLEQTALPVLAARAPLDRMAALLARCRLAIGVDTGLLHLAAAVGTRYVGLFGPTNPAVTGPYDRSLGTALVAPFAKPRTCDGCWRQFKYIDDRCRTIPRSSCMSALPVEAVLDACAGELANSERPEQASGPMVALT